MTVDHRTFVAWMPDPWGADRDGKDVLELLKQHGLQPHHRLLDFGCGSLRVGRWLIPYLDAGNYFGIDPELWLVEMARLEEVPDVVWKEKVPTFDGNCEWDFTVFGGKFDYILVCDVLLHAAHWQIEKIIGGIAMVLAPGGVALGDILFDGDYEGDEWQYPSVARHQVECLTKPAMEVGLGCQVADVVERSWGITLHWFKFTRRS